VARSSQAETIRAFYRTLFRAWGRQHWWPAQSRFEVIVGAFLTQNTAWSNVERALAGLRRARALSLRGIRETPPAELEQLIRSAGYFRQKARRLKNFVAFLDRRYGGSLDRLFAQPTAQVRRELLGLNGVGPETADSILLYAGNHPVFVVDAYTRRTLERHGIVGAKADYDDIRLLAESALGDASFVEECAGQSQAWDRGERSASALPAGSCHQPSRASTMSRSAQAQVFNEMHGLIVGVGKNFCSRRDPDCARCPLGPLLPKPPARRQGPLLIMK
jgi:endonuclease-3 related protein